MWRAARSRWAWPKWAWPLRPRPSIAARRRHLVLNPRKMEQKKPQTTCFNGFRCCLSGFFFCFLIFIFYSSWKIMISIINQASCCPEGCAQSPRFWGSASNFAVFIPLGGGVGCVALFEPPKIQEGLSYQAPFC